PLSQEAKSATEVDQELRRQIERSSSENEELRRQIEHSGNERAVLARRTEHAEGAFLLLQQQQHDQKQRITDLQDQIDQILTSTSWRLTAPMRAVKNGLRWPRR